jgi:predicted fused transcriptional regulator/phosphomethylpyrimidine kinase
MRAACLPSTTVTVTVNGRALQELQQIQIDRGSDKGASAFIGSAAGAAFAVEMDIEAGLAVKFKPENSVKRQRSEVVNLDDSDGEDVSIVAVNTKRVKTAGSPSVEVLDLTGE